MTLDELADELQTLRDKIDELQKVVETKSAADPDNYVLFGVKKSLQSAHIAIKFACELAPQFPTLGGYEE